MSNSARLLARAKEGTGVLERVLWNDVGSVRTGFIVAGLEASENSGGQGREGYGMQLVVSHWYVVQDTATQRALVQQLETRRLERHTGSHSTARPVWNRAIAHRAAVRDSRILSFQYNTEPRVLGFVIIQHAQQRDDTCCPHVLCG